MKYSKLEQAQIDYLFLESQYRNLSTFIRNLQSQITHEKMRKIEPGELYSPDKKQMKIKQLQDDLKAAENDFIIIVKLMDKAGKEILHDYQTQHAIEFKYLLRDDDNNN